MSVQPLFTPLRMGDLDLPNRIVMAPVHGEFIIGTPPKRQPVLLPGSPMWLKLVAYGKCDCIVDASARQTIRCFGTLRNPDCTG